MPNFATSPSKNLTLALAASFCLLFSACNQNSEKLQEREKRDEAAKAAKSSTSTNTDTLVVE